MDNNKYYPMNSAELLDSILDVYKKSFLKQIAITMIFGIMFTAIIYLVIFAGGITVALSLMSNMPSFSNPMDAFWKLLPSIIVFLIVFVIISIIYQALNTTGNSIITKQTFLNEPTDIGAVLKQSFKKILQASSAGLANLIVMIPLIVIVSIFLYVYIMMIVEITGNNTFPATLTIVVTIALAIVMLIVSIVCSAITMMSMSVAVFENKYFFSALKKSFQLVKPDFFKILGLIAVWSLIVSATSYSISIVFNFAPVFVEMFFPQESAGVFSMIFMSLGSIISMAVSTLLAPLTGIFSTMMYINQRFKHEGLDMELNLNEINAQRLKKQFEESFKAPPTATPYPYGYNPGQRR